MAHQLLQLCWHPVHLGVAVTVVVTPLIALQGRGQDGLGAFLEDQWVRIWPPTPVRAWLCLLPTPVLYHRPAQKGGAGAENCLVPPCMGASWVLCSGEASVTLCWEGRGSRPGCIPEPRGLGPLSCR